MRPISAVGGLRSVPVALSAPLQQGEAAKCGRGLVRNRLQSPVLSSACSRTTPAVAANQRRGADSVCFESRHDCHLLVWRLELYFGELRPMSVHTLSSCGPQRGDESSEFVSASPGDGPDWAGGGGDLRAQGGRRLSANTAGRGSRCRADSGATGRFRVPALRPRGVVIRRPLRLRGS